jgi:hypothetical protein
VRAEKAERLRFAEPLVSADEEVLMRRGVQ